MITAGCARPCDNVINQADVTEKELVARVFSWLLVFDCEGLGFFFLTQHSSPSLCSAWQALVDASTHAPPENDVFNVL